jgi:hypothetical protein
VSNFGAILLSQSGPEGAQEGDDYDDYKVVLYRNQPDGCVAQVPAIRGCYALMPTREEALAELGRVFEMIALKSDKPRMSLPPEP